MRTSFCLFLCWAVTSCSGILPARDQTVGSCTQESDCGAGGQACKAHQCVPCGAHSDCASQVCDTYGDLGGTGQCVPASHVIYADSTDPNGVACSAATGSQCLPWCDIGGALGQLKMNPGLIIALHSSPTAYVLPALDQSAGAVVLIGPGQFTAGKTATLVSNAPETRLELGSGANVVIDGLGLSVSGVLATQGAKVTIRRSSMSYMTKPASFDSCTVNFDRDILTTNTLALSVKSSTMSITNTLITGNTAQPSTSLLDFSGSSGVFQFNTVAYNSLGSSSGLVVNCANAPGLVVKNSIFVQNAVTQQLAANCAAVANSLVLGKADSTPGQLSQDPAFVDVSVFDLRLRPQDPTNTQYLFDKAVQVNPATEKNVDHDYYGTRRPQGSGYDIGAFELAAP